MLTGPQLVIAILAKRLAKCIMAYEHYETDDGSNCPRCGI